MQLNQKNWSCPKKQKARWETIVSQYRANFGQSLPPDRQYWTICGQCTTPTGEPLHGCEIWQTLENGLITSDQFRGVEIDEKIHKLNAEAFPEINWYNNDFYRSMVLAKSKNEFKPGIVNIDLPKTPDGGASYISKIMAFLSNCEEDMLVVANVIIRQRFYKTKNGDYVIDLLNKQQQFRFAMSTGKWKLLERYYDYDGAGRTGGRTWMASFVFLKT
jgi:hypothetical protein